MQKAVYTARGHVDATWHSGPRGSTTRAHTAYSIYNIYLLYIYKMGLQPSHIGKGCQPYKSLGLINPMKLFHLIRVGLIHAVPYNATDVARRGALDRDDAFD